MRAIVLLCMLQAVFGELPVFSWYKPGATTHKPDPHPYKACLTDQSACGCCLMQTYLNRMETLFNESVKELQKYLMKSKMALNNMRGSRSAFSVALNDDNSMNCFGGGDFNGPIVYKHVFINLGDNYDVNTGYFTAPRAGVYCFTVTIYYDALQKSCATLRVNGVSMAELRETQMQVMDDEDSATVIMTMKLRAGDKVAVSLLDTECVICDDISHYNTFTGFLLYATD